MSTEQPSAAGDEAHRPDDAAARRPTVDEMSEWSFPASDPPATWNWEPRGQRHPGVRADESVPPKSA